MKVIFDRATRKGSDLVVNSDMTAESRSLRTQLYHMLMMMLSDQALRNLLWEYEPGVGVRYRAMLHSLVKRRLGEHDETGLARKIESFWRDISKYEQQASRLISDAIKHGILCGGMTHQGLKQHIDLSISGWLRPRRCVTRSSIKAGRAERGQIHTRCKSTQCTSAAVRNGKAAVATHSPTKAKAVKAVKASKAKEKGGKGMDERQAGRFEGECRYSKKKGPEEGGVQADAG